jgi:hypothetical protein
MTLAAILAYRGLRPPTKSLRSGEKWAVKYMDEPEWSVGGKAKHLTYGLIFGTWWNDDPNMYLLGQSWDFAKGVKRLNRVHDEAVHEDYPSDLGCPVAASQHLGRASHYGEVQYLHFMDTLGKDHSSAAQLENTTTRAMKWIEFAYAVAVGDIDPEAPFSSANEQDFRLPSIARNLCLLDSNNVKVRSVFTRQGPATKENLAYRNRLTRDVALGSILHILQDSFSPAHTCRKPVGGDGGNLAVLVRVDNYNEQDHSVHESKDGYPTWFREYLTSGNHRYVNDPVVVGAWLFGAVDSQLPWKTVESYLRQTIFLAESNSLARATDCL